MTRINCIPVTELTDKHLIAEYRELPRVFRLAKELPPIQIPKEYVLGTGHVKFFYNKLRYLARRYLTIVAEMKRRGFKVSYPDPKFPQVHQLELYNDWQPTPSAQALNRQRISERLK